MGSFGMIPPPPSGTPTGEFGPQPPPAGMDGRSALPAPPSAPDPMAMQAVRSVTTINAALDSLAQQFPATVEEADQIRQLMKQIQIKILRSMAPVEPPAPPI